MSTILKALRRLEDEKKVQDERSLRERVLAGESAPEAEGGTRRVGLLVILGSFVLLAGAGVAAFFLWDDSADTASGSAVSEAEETAPDPKKPPGLMAFANPPRPVIRKAPVAQYVPPVPDADPAAVAPSEPVIVTDDVAMVTRSQAAAPALPAAKPIAKPVVKSTPKPAPKPVAKPVPQPVAKPAPKPIAKPVPKPVAKPAPKPVAQVAPSKAPPMPKVERVPIPDFVVTRTVWHPNAARRVASVQLKGQVAAQTVSEGDEFATLEVVEIQPAAVLFRRDGVEIKRRIGRQ